MHSDAPSSPSLRGHARPGSGLAILLLGGFVTLFDLFVVTVAVPVIQTGLQASFAQVGFIIVGYELGFGLLLITGGRLGDRFGRRRLIAAGMAGFSAALALCGFAPEVNFLIAATVLQGMTAALLFPQVYASIRVSFNGDDRRRAFGLLGMTLGLAAIAGQVLGGWLIQANVLGLGWRVLFLINVPVGLFAVVMARLIPESRAPVCPPLDWARILLVSAGLACLLIPLIEGPERGWPAWSEWTAGAACVLLALFVRQQERVRRRGDLPLVDMQLMRQRRFSLGALLVLLVYSTSSAFFLCFALLMQTGLGLNPFVAGSLFAPCSGGFVVSSLFMPRLVRRMGTPAIVTGAGVYAASLAALIAQVHLAGAALVPVQLIPVLVVAGAGQGAIMTPLLNLLLSSVEEKQAGMASGVISTLQQTGAALGVAVTGLAFRAALTAGSGTATQADHYARAFVAGMLCNLGAALLVCIVLMTLATRKRVTD